MSMGSALFSTRFRHARRSLWARGGLLVLGFLACTGQSWGKACVWKVTSGEHTLYLAGSVHALRGVDYPLPPEYDQAFNASGTLAFEVDPAATHEKWSRLLSKAEAYPHGTRLRDHLDPRVYAYILRVISNIQGASHPEEKLAHFRPWAIAWRLESPGGIDGISRGQGVEAYLTRKAINAHKKMVGLVPLDEHIGVFGGMSDADSQAFLLLTFIGLNQEDKAFQQMVGAWKRGDIDTVDRTITADYREVPSLRNRIITDRNRRWVPEIAQWLQSGRTYMVVAGAAHMGGEAGLPALLRARGFQVEQL